MDSRTFNRSAGTVLALCIWALLAPTTIAFAQTPPDASNIDCQRASTQAELNACAYEDFLVTQAGMADELKRLQTGFSAEQRAGLRRVQRAWLSFRTEACAFESRNAGVSSSQPMLQWQCTARLTRERTAVLVRAVNCPEGDLTCIRPPASGAPSR